MARQVHLVGSVGLRDAETVFTTVSVMLGSCCPRIPDGETGERGYWIRWQRNTFARNLGFEEVMTTRSRACLSSPKTEGLHGRGVGCVAQCQSNAISSGN